LPARAGLLQVASKIGRAVARLHDGGVVHGDLTTSNMILRESDGTLVRPPGASHAAATHA
jgi:TP53 regulating kinase-like protein